MMFWTTSKKGHGKNWSDQFLGTILGKCIQIQIQISIITSLESIQSKKRFRFDHFYHADISQNWNGSWFENEKKKTLLRKTRGNTD